MKKGIVLLTIVSAVVLNVIQVDSYYAQETSYISNGQASFYGEYVYDSSEEQTVSEDKSNEKAEKNEGNAVSTKIPSKATILPETGDYINPSYQMIGTSIVVLTLLWVLNKKGKEYIR